jgi:dTDP-4-amino-4,6-dideoxygalactose transaminase
MRDASPTIISPLHSWIASEFSDYSHVYFGLSGGSLLFDALRHEPRTKVILPAFICPTVSAMAACAGKQVVHVDVEPRTMHMHPGKLAAAIERCVDTDSVLLFDHTFGYPVPDVLSWKARYPALLIIEDCVRGHGASVNGAPVGHAGDLVLLSMYKNTVGNYHGAVLLTRQEYPIRVGEQAPPSGIEWAAGVAPLRIIHDALKRFRGDFSASPRNLDKPYWAPIVGSPNRLTQMRYCRQVATLGRDAAKRSEAASEIHAGLGDESVISFIDCPAHCNASAYFLSFTVCSQVDRDHLLGALHRRGHYLVRAWNTIPAFFRCFADTFPAGNEGSLQLADSICHVPLSHYSVRRRRHDLIRNIKAIVHESVAAVSE